VNKQVPDVNDTMRENGTDAVRERHDRIRKHQRKPDAEVVALDRKKTRKQNRSDDRREHAEQLGEHTAAAVDNHQRPFIKVAGGALHDTATKAEAALIAAGVPFYARGDEIVRPVMEKVPAFHNRTTMVPRVKAVNLDTMRDYLSRSVHFQKWDKRAKKLVSIDPPHDIAAVILARVGEWLFPPLAGLIGTPTLRPDGSVLAVPGYDPATGLLLLNPPPMPAIPERPSKDEAMTALGVINPLLDDFPFVNKKVDRAAGLSVLMTPVLRGAMEVAPLHAASSPEARTGKSYLFDLSSAIATGDRAPVLSAGRDEEETEKRIDAALLKGQPIIAIDNLNGELGGARLCQAVERPSIQVRILGLSKAPTVVNTVCVFGNGNNMRLVGDITPRTLQISLDAKMERPELRHFRGDPLASILADRGRYVAAILTIARAYLAAGCPDLLSLASFGEWTRLVRCPLIWLGCDDPWKTNETVRGDDPTRAELLAVIAAWRDLIGLDTELTASELKDRALESTPKNKDLKLHKAIVAVAHKHNRNEEIDPLRLGQWLGRNKNRVVNLQIKENVFKRHQVFGKPDAHKQMRWSLIEPKEPDNER
jgi:putative DNA primase/helicase